MILIIQIARVVCALSYRINNEIQKEDLIIVGWYTVNLTDIGTEKLRKNHVFSKCISFCDATKSSQVYEQFQIQLLDVLRIL